MTTTTPTPTTTSTTTKAPSPPTRLWRFLMQPVGKRVPIRRGRGAPHGVALLTVMVALALMSAVVTDLGTNELVRYRLASNDRDALKAQALAESSLNISRLLLAMQSAVQPMITQLSGLGLPLPAFTFWELVPLDSELLKGLVSGDLQQAVGLDVSASLEDRRAQHVEKMDATRAEYDGDKDGARFEGPFEPPEGGFGAFDGQFTATIVDEERKAASLRGWATADTPQKRFPYAQRLYTLFQAERYDFLFDERDAQGNRTDRHELIANIYDWIDNNQEATDGRADQNNWGRVTIGNEDANYSSGYKVEPKNAYFDSPGELRLVRGMTEAHMRAFGDSISLYGEGKINLLSAPDATIEALVFACATPNDPLPNNPIWMQETVITWRQFKTLGPLAGGGPINGEGFMQMLDMRGLEVNETCKDLVTTESRNFTVKAMGTVGEVTRTLTVVMRVYGANEETYYFAVR
jgi:general secretion pathway protein K